MAAADEDAADEGLGARAEKSASAFRTISEVSDSIEVPQHVLRFWETKFPQIRPLKRGGGRRYYRPEDVELLRRIRSLLYSEGYTIKGVQRLLRNGRGGKLRPEGEAAGSEPIPVVTKDGKSAVETDRDNTVAPPAFEARDAGHDPGNAGAETGAETGAEIGPRSNPGGDAGVGGDAVRLAEVEAAVRQEFSEIRAEVAALRDLLRRRLG
ncbi:MAG: MerR family transcriptional regulator [Alphaproteobacteria bacterium]